MGSVDKGRFGSKVLKSWLLQGGGETIFQCLSITDTVVLTIVESK
jgi:hypothetical protein